MRKSILIVITGLAIITNGCQKTSNYVLTGQLYDTPSPGSIEKIYGKVKEMKITNFQVKEENGKTLKGNELTAADRKTYHNMEPTFMEEYSPSGIILKSVSYDENGKVTSYCTVESTEKIINKITYYSADTALAYGKTTYNGNNLEEVRYFNPKNDTLYMSIKYEYDKNGNRVKLQTYNYKGEPGGYTLYKYNNNGFLIQSASFNKDGNPTSQIDCTRSDKGDRLTSHYQSFGTNRVEYSYTFKSEYDKLGNWIKVIMYMDNKPIVYRERQIQYYD